MPRWIVCGAGTGGTSATIGRFLRFRRHATRLCVADPVASIFHRHHVDRRLVELPDGSASRIEGIGRSRVEPSFVPEVVDRMIAVEDDESIGAMHALSARLRWRVGGSTGTNLWACVRLAHEMRTAGMAGSIVTLLCDRGERYACTYYDGSWLARNGVVSQVAERRVAAMLGGTSAQEEDEWDDEAEG